MKRIFLFAGLLLAATGTTLAQAPKVALSAAFPEPENGANRLLLLKNGNTLYFHFTPSDGIRAVVYDANHKQKAQTTLTGKTWEDHDMKRSELKGLYEINGQAVIFLQQLNKRTPTLYRIVVDPQTGRVVKEDQIGELPKYGAFAGYSMLFGHVKPDDFYVEKDPESDYYAVVQFHGFSSETNARIEVVHYSPDHQELNRAFLSSPGNKYKYLDYQAIYVHGADYVFIATYGYNSEKGKDAKLIIASLPKGAKAFNQTALDYTEGYRDVLSGLVYDAPNKTLRLLTITNAANLERESGIKYHSRSFILSLAYIDPAKLQVTHHNYVEDSYINDYAKDHLGFKHDYVGMPQDFVLNPDGSATILMEELVQIYHSRGSEGYWTTEFNEIGVARIDALGQETAGYALAKSQEAMGYYPYWHNYRRDRGEWSFRTNGLMGNHTLAPFFSYQYMHPQQTEYIIFNDYNVNIRNTSESYRGKKEMHYASETSSLCVRKTPDGKTEKFFLYGDPGDQDINRYTILESTIRTADQKTMVTLMVEKDGRKDAQAHVAWIDFQ